MRALHGLSVLITGGGSGLGQGTARRFAAGGARVTVCGRREHKVGAVAKELGETCQAVRCDVTDPEDRAATLDAALRHGGGRLDALVCAAGNMYRGPLESLDEAKLLEVFHTNVVGHMMLAGAAVEHLAESNGAVVLFGSVHTQRAFPGSSPYAATKGALETLTGVLAAELGPRGIRVGCVRPGAVFTEINQRAGPADDKAAYDRLQSLSTAHALNRIGTPDEIAEAVEYLVRAEWTTGGVLTVDGGLALGVTNA